jgi:hypothetical protein
MKQVTPMSQKNRCKQILILWMSLFALTSCNIEPLPDKIKSDHLFAIPIVDTTVLVSSFADFPNYGQLLEQIKIPAGTPIHMGAQEYPFYIGDYASSQEIEWIEPHLIIDTKDLPSGTEINIRIYTQNEYREKLYFWLPADYSVTLVNTPLNVPENPQRIRDIEQIRNARKVFLDTYFTFPETVSATEIMNDIVNIKFAMQLAIKTNLRIAL